MDFPKYRINPGIYADKAEPSKGLRAKEIAGQNIVCRLAGRELWGSYGRRVGTEKHLQRSMCQSIYPNFTVTNVDKPPCFLRKFTPDGKYFVAFSADQMSVEVYYFQGPQAANDLFEELGKDWINKENETVLEPPVEKKSRSSSSNEKRAPEKPYCRGFADNISADHKDQQSQTIRGKIFDAFFSLKFRVSVPSQGEQLNIECSLFTEDFRYMIVGTAKYIYTHPRSHIRNNESVEPNPEFPLEDYSIHIIDINNGILTDSKSFKTDKIFLTQNQGLYLYNNTLAVLSVQHQTITLLHVENGQFSPIRILGKFCYEDDEVLYSAVPEFASTRAKEEAFINSLKQRLLTYLFKKAKASANDLIDPDRSGLSRFYQDYDQLMKLRIWKMQLLDEDHLLLKYSSEEVVTLRSAEPHPQHCIFVIYNIPTTEILAVFENTTEFLVEFFENFSDSFRNNNLTLDARYASSPSNNIFSKQILQQFRQTITSALGGGPVEAMKRILAQLPISAQSYSASPYLDQGLFSYADHRISAMERPKACGKIPIRFYGRDSGLYKFQIHAGILARGSSPEDRRLVGFIFHPSAPFAISVQRVNNDNNEYFVHFHLRLDTNSIVPSS